MKTKAFMNVLKSSMYVIMAVLMMGAVTSCSDEDGPTNPPKYASEAAKYKITDNASSIKSVELTEGGSYIITPHKIEIINNNDATNMNSAASMLKEGVWHAPMNIVPATRNVSTSGMIYGDYTKSGNGQYHLIGYGTLTVTKNEGNDGYVIILDSDTDEPVQYTAQKLSYKDHGSMTDKLCRTWVFESFAYNVKLNGKTVFNVQADDVMDMVEKFNKWARENGYEEIDIDDVDEDEFPNKVIFTKSGTYVVFYADNELDVANWNWENEAKGILRYDWNDDMDDEECDDMDYEERDDMDYDGIAKMNFKKGKLHVVEMAEYEEDGMGFTETFTTILREQK